MSYRFNMCRRGRTLWWGCKQVSSKHLDGTYLRFSNSRETSEWRLCCKLERYENLETTELFLQKHRHTHTRWTWLRTIYKIKLWSALKTIFAEMSNYGVRTVGNACPFFVLLTSCPGWGMMWWCQLTGWKDFTRSRSAGFLNKECNAFPQVYENFFFYRNNECVIIHWVK